jgi:hypothetical protein
MSAQQELRKRFVAETLAVEEPKVLVTACRLPGGAIETAENRENLENKILYILDAYDDEFRLVRNPEVQIVGYLIV